MSLWRTTWTLANHAARYARTSSKASTQPLTYSKRTCSLRCYATTSTIHASDLAFGQPLHETHPHILSPGELTPGISAQEYADRRSTLARQLPQGAVAIVAAADVQFRSGSVFYEFHQDPDFLYLTGFNEPEALAVIGKDSTGTDHTFHLYVRQKDPKAEVWEGARSGTQAAIDVFNADEAGDINDVKRKLKDIVGSASLVFTDIMQPDQNMSTLKHFLYGRPRKTTEFAEIIDSSKIKPLRPVMNTLRAFKSPAEIEILRSCGKISGRAHSDAMKRSWTREKDLDAFLRYRFLANGCDSIAFEPVVAGGKNALGIHYVRNDDVLQDGQMVLVDGGGKYAGYISDITRTWPVSGKFTAAQRDLYEAVLIVQRTLISMCRETANMSLDKLHSMAEQMLTDQLKILKFNMSGKSAIEALFPHHISHYMGMDVHDTTGYSRKTNLQDGHCITIEPGIYVPDDERWPKHFRNMAIRIEDSVCVQEDNPLVLSTEAAKEVVDIEALRH